jgi:hypothetical protein
MSLLVGLISLLVLAVVVPIVVRVSARRNAIGVIIACAMGIHIAGIVAGAILLFELDYWQAAALYWFGTIVLVYAYGTCYRSLSVQMLVAIADKAPHPIESSMLYQSYFRRFVRDRIDALVEGGRAELRGGQLNITRAGRSDAALILRARRIFGLKESRLYFRKMDSGRIGS